MAQPYAGVQRALVVGAGVAGLQAARALLRNGIQVVLLEENEDVGGVWLRNYQGYGLQVEWEMYQFPEFPFPRKAELKTYPTGDQVREYVQAYARHFGLYQYCLFNSRLASLTRREVPQRQQQQQHTGDGATARDCAGAASRASNTGCSFPRSVGGSSNSAAQPQGPLGACAAQRRGAVCSSSARPVRDDTATSGSTIQYSGGCAPQPIVPTRTPTSGTDASAGGGDAAAADPAACERSNDSAAASAAAAANGSRPGSSSILGAGAAGRGAVVGGAAGVFQAGGADDGGGSSTAYYWEAVYEDLHSGRQYRLEADFVILSTGLYAAPFIPHVKGQDVYRGLQVHSRDFTDARVAAGKAVLIVGGGKTALDCISELTAAAAAKSITLLYRRPHWPLPRAFGCLSFKQLAYNRAISAALPAYYAASPAQKARAALLTPLRKLFWVTLMRRVNTQLGIKKSLGSPAAPICQDIWYSGQVLELSWPRTLANKAVETVQGELSHLTPVSAVLKDGRELQPDVVLYATGYSATYPFLDAQLQRRLNMQEDGLYLYRSVLPPGLPGLAFIGAEVTTFNNILTSGLQSEWLAGVLTGRVALPDPKGMAKDVEKQMAWKRASMPRHRLRGSSIMLYQQAYHDQLVMDLGLPSSRKHGGLLRPFAECVEPYTALDYDDVFVVPPKPKGPAAAAAAVATRTPLVAAAGLLQPVDPRQRGLVAPQAGAPTARGSMAAATSAAGASCASALSAYDTSATTAARGTASSGVDMPSGSANATAAHSMSPGGAGGGCSSGSGGRSGGGHKSRGGAVQRSSMAKLAAALGLQRLLTASDASPDAAAPAVETSTPPSMSNAGGGTASAGSAAGAAPAGPLPRAFSAPRVPVVPPSPSGHPGAVSAAAGAADDDAAAVPPHDAPPCSVSSYEQRATLYELEGLLPALKNYRHAPVLDVHQLQSEIEAENERALAEGAAPAGPDDMAGCGHRGLAGTASVTHGSASPASTPGAAGTRTPRPTTNSPASGPSSSTFSGACGGDGGVTAAADHESGVVVAGGGAAGPAALGEAARRVIAGLTRSRLGVGAHGGTPYDSSRKEPSSAVGELAYRALPPRHVEEQMRAAAATAAAAAAAAAGGAGAGAGPAAAGGMVPTAAGAAGPAPTSGEGDGLSTLMALDEQAMAGGGAPRSDAWVSNTFGTSVFSERRVAQEYASRQREEFLRLLQQQDQRMHGHQPVQQGQERPSPLRQQDAALWVAANSGSGASFTPTCSTIVPPPYTLLYGGAAAPSAGVEYGNAASAAAPQPPERTSSGVSFVPSGSTTIGQGLYGVFARPWHFHQGGGGAASGGRPGTGEYSTTASSSEMQYSPVAALRQATAEARAAGGNAEMESVMEESTISISTSRW